MRGDISVVLATHNGQQYLPQQLASIASQTLRPAEVVVGDDASSDDTLAIVLDWAASSGIRVLVREHRPALGVRDNFADAVQHASGELIAMCDQDDVWVPNRLERLSRPFADGALLVHSDARLVDAAGADLGATLSQSLEMSDWERAQLSAGNALKVFLRRNLVTGATAMVRTDFAKAALPIPDGWIHDEWFAMLAAIEGGVVYLPETLTDYRQHGSNQIGVRRLTLRQKFGRLVEADSGSHARKALRATTLARAAETRGLGTAEERAALVAKARHERTRAALPDFVPARIPAIVRGTLAGNYRSYSRGLLDVARDLLERH